jgi:hypothetical protein
MTILEHLWQAKWGILFIGGFIALIVALAASDQRKPPFDDCEANGGRMVIPRMDEREPQPNRIKTSPAPICKYD